jgi:hypothetical protein
MHIFSNPHTVQYLEATNPSISKSDAIEHANYPLKKKVRSNVMMQSYVPPKPPAPIPCGYAAGDFTFIHEFGSSSTDTTVMRLKFMYAKLRYIPLHDPTNESDAQFLQSIINGLKNIYAKRGFNEFIFHEDFQQIRFIYRRGWDDYVRFKMTKLQNRNL